MWQTIINSNPLPKATMVLIQGLGFHELCELFKISNDIHYFNMEVSFFSMVTTSATT